MKTLNTYFRSGVLPLASHPLSSTIYIPDRRTYIVEIRTFTQELFFSVVQEGKLFLSETGQIVADEWVHSSRNYRGIELDSWTVKPDRLAGIVIVHSLPDAMDNDSSQSWSHSSKPRLLSTFIASFKAAAATRINLICNQPGTPIWQRSYDETLITDTTVLAQIRQDLDTLKRCYHNSADL